MDISLHLSNSFQFGNYMIYALKMRGWASGHPEEPDFALRAAVLRLRPLLNLDPSLFFFLKSLAQQK